MRPSGQEPDPPAERGSGFAYSAILWDLDGTLVDSEPVHQRSFLDTCDSFGLVLPGDFHDHLIGKSEDAIHRYLVETHGLEVSLPQWSERRFAAYLARIDEVRAIAVTQDLWHTAVSFGVRQAIVSNSPRQIVHANLRRLGLRPDAVATVSRDDVSRGKPSPDPYLLAAERLLVSSSSAAVVEDSRSGLESARAAGMSVFMMPSFEGGDDQDWQPIEVLHRAARQLLPK